MRGLIQIVLSSRPARQFSSKGTQDTGVVGEGSLLTPAVAMPALRTSRRVGEVILIMVQSGGNLGEPAVLGGDFRTDFWGCDALERLYWDGDSGEHVASTIPPEDRLFYQFRDRAAVLRDHLKP